MDNEAHFEAAIAGVLLGRVDLLQFKFILGDDNDSLREICDIDVPFLSLMAIIEGLLSKVSRGEEEAIGD
jgi:hypothetical protein